MDCAAGARRERSAEAVTKKRGFRRTGRSCLSALTSVTARAATIRRRGRYRDLDRAAAADREHDQPLRTARGGAPHHRRWSVGAIASLRGRAYTRPAQVKSLRIAEDAMMRVHVEASTAPRDGNPAGRDLSLGYLPRAAGMSARAAAVRGIAGRRRLTWFGQSCSARDPTGTAFDGPSPRVLYPCPHR